MRSELSRETGNIIKIVALKTFAIQMVCALICSERVKKKNDMEEEMVKETRGARIADIVIYNSSLNFPLPCILLSHWL